jgi:hypothetical protein
VAVEPDGRGRSARLFYLWPEHQEVLGVFLAARTQWRAGFAGALGLDYAGVEALVRMRRLVPRTRLPDVIAELQILEAETLAEWGRQRAAVQARA